MTRTFDIEPRGKKWATVCRTDGYWSITWLSKTKRRARQKGEEFVSGERTAMRKYTTPLGRTINEMNSQPRFRGTMISGTGRMTKAQFAALMVGALGLHE